MHAIAFQLLTILVAAGDPAAPANSLLTDLVTKGVTMPDGQIVQLPEPIMAEGLTAAEEAEVLKRSAPRGNVLEFTSTRSNALVSLKIGKLPSKQGNDLIRTINLCFVVYGDWNVLTSDEFSKSILKKDKAKSQNDEASTVTRAGYLKTPELAVRGLTTRSTSNSKESFLYTTFKLFDQAEVSATRYGVATKTPTGVVVAARVDPRFARDKEYPNQWRSITRGGAAVAEFGPPKPYSGAGFYAKVTRLIQPTNAIFVEYHSTFYEPADWFGAENDKLMPSELRKIIPYQVQQFRAKLLIATKKAAEKAAEGQK